MRRDIVEIVRAAARSGSTPTSSPPASLTGERELRPLVEAGLDHVQLVVQDAEPGSADRIGGYRGGHAQEAGSSPRLVHDVGLPLTVNVVVHRQNLDGSPALIDLALALGAGRLEIAHVQYYGWALGQPRRPAADPRPAGRGDRDRRGGARDAARACW